MAERLAASVAITGPDGAGKSTIAERLATELLAEPVLHIHHRPGILPGRPFQASLATDPHGQEPYPRWLALGKLLYLFGDYQLGRWRFRQARRAGGSVLIERGWHDLVVDPRRYRLDPFPRLVQLLSKLVRRPDLTIVLVADPELLSERKQELPLPELRRQVDAWTSFALASPRALLVDTATPLEEIIDTIAARLRTATGVTRDPHR